MKCVGTVCRPRTRADARPLPGSRLRDAVSAESQALKLGREWLAHYWPRLDVLQSGDWAAEERCYAEKVRYYYEGEVTRDFLHHSG